MIEFFNATASVCFENIFSGERLKRLKTNVEFKLQQIDRCKNSKQGSEAIGCVSLIFIRGIRTFVFSRKTTNAVLYDLKIVGVVK